MELHLEPLPLASNHLNSAGNLERFLDCDLPEILRRHRSDMATFPALSPGGRPGVRFAPIWFGSKIVGGTSRSQAVEW